jgi:hypothetical protein
MTKPWKLQLVQPPEDFSRFLSRESLRAIRVRCENLDENREESKWVSRSTRSIKVSICKVL